MCGLFCFISKDEVSDDIVKNSLKLLKNRGPDAVGVSKHRLGNLNIVLGHTRLSILDLSKNSNQPFSENGWHLIFNGEIYNHLELRKKFLKTATFRTTSDTETLIKLFINYEPSFFLNDIRGMFSFVIFNQRENKFFVCRDRAGEKPLYISTSEGFISFASDLRVNRLLQGFNSSISKKSLGMFLRYGYVPSPYSIYEDSFKLPAGAKLEFNLSTLKINRCIKIEDLAVKNKMIFSKWWEMPKIAENKLPQEEAKEQLKNTLYNATKMQQISDVPVGTFLSGGIDSSLITSFIAQNSSNIKCFNIGFEFSNYDESKYAKKIASHLGLTIENLMCSKELALNEIQNIHNAYDEPFADSSQIPTMLISRLASKEVKVILTGDCGDELFGGYNRYLLGKKYARLISSTPKIIKDSINSISRTPFISIIEPLVKRLSPDLFSGSFVDRFQKGARKIQGIESDLDFYNSMVSEWKYEDKIFSGNLLQNHIIDESFVKYEDQDIIDKMMLADFNTYMSDDILCKVDRASMNYSLETRVPFLDLDVIELSRKISQEDKISKNNRTKKILREILKEFIPEKLFERPKQGFGVPVSIWLKKELKDWAYDHISKETNSKHNFFNQEVVEKIFKEHVEGKVNHEYKLWYLIQFNQWYLNNHEL